MLIIRLQRVGKRKQAYFRIVVIEHTRKPKGKYLEFLGSWNPHQNTVTVDADRAKYWMSQGVQLSNTVHNLFVGKGILPGPKRVVWKPKKKTDGISTVSQQAEPKKEIAPAPAAGETPADVAAQNA